MKNAFFLLVALLLVTACATTQSAPTSTILPTDAPSSTPIPTSTITPIPPTATATSTPTTPPPMLCEGVEGTCVEFRFEPGKCSRVGPEFIPAGEITLIFSNYVYGVYESGIEFEILDEGKTWNDMRRYIGRDGSYASPPKWSVDVSNAVLFPGRNYTSARDRLTAGTYIAVCATLDNHRLWLAEQLVVEE